jgi:hypothetical protein
MREAQRREHPERLLTHGSFAVFDERDAADLDANEEVRQNTGAVQSGTRDLNAPAGRLVDSMPAPVACVQPQ